eukprot:TRINITY_DN2362_c0_g1_i1.p1 TRINITY_DN2362_c0_g1~~TRINITY_DN2362_c0_g1_i1.p1  ORF type:complete len:762 (-),score=141.06 TRINITY_DN2362_c0_g1_i1:248-2494(-)
MNKSASVPNAASRAYSESPELQKQKHSRSTSFQRVYSTKLWALNGPAAEKSGKKRNQKLRARPPVSELSMAQAAMLLANGPDLKPNRDTSELGVDPATVVSTLRWYAEGKPVFLPEPQGPPPIDRPLGPKPNADALIVSPDDVAWWLKAIGITTDCTCRLRELDIKGATVPRMRISDWRALGISDFAELKAVGAATRRLAGANPTMPRRLPGHVGGWAGSAARAMRELHTPPPAYGQPAEPFHPPPPLHPIHEQSYSGAENSALSAPTALSVPTLAVVRPNQPNQEASISPDISDISPERQKSVRLSQHSLQHKTYRDAFDFVVGCRSLSELEEVMQMKQLSEGKKQFLRTVWFAGEWRDPELTEFSERQQRKAHLEAKLPQQLSLKFGLSTPSQSQSLEEEVTREQSERQRRASIERHAAGEAERERRRVLELELERERRWLEIEREAQERERLRLHEEAREKEKESIVRMDQERERLRTLELETRLRQEQENREKERIERERLIQHERDLLQMQREREREILRIELEEREKDRQRERDEWRQAQAQLLEERRRERAEADRRLAEATRLHRQVEEMAALLEKRLIVTPVDSQFPQKDDSGKQAATIPGAIPDSVPAVPVVDMFIERQIRKKPLATAGEVGEATLAYTGNAFQVEETSQYRDLSSSPVEELRNTLKDALVDSLREFVLQLQSAAPIGRRRKRVPKEIPLQEPPEPSDSSDATNDSDSSSSPPAKQALQKKEEQQQQQQ